MLTNFSSLYKQQLLLRTRAAVKGRNFIVWLYYCVSLLLSIIYLQLPLFYSAHESQLFLYAAGISYGELYQPGSIPKSLPQLVSSIKQHTAPPEQLVAGNAQPFVPAQNVTKYSFLSLLPQVAGTGISYLLDVSPVTMVYLARAFCMLTAVIVGTLTLYLLPCLRWQVFYCMLLPSGFILRSSEYADPMLNTACFLYFALLVRLLHSRQRVRCGHFLGFGILSLCVALSKVLYFPLCFTTLILTQENFSSLRQRIFFQLFVISAGVLATLIWVPQASMAHYHVDLWSLARSFYDPSQRGMVDASINPSVPSIGPMDPVYLHFLAVVHHPFLILHKFLNTIETDGFVSRSAFNFFFWYIDIFQPLMKRMGTLVPEFAPLLLIPFLLNQRCEPEHGIWPFALMRWQRVVLGVAMAATYCLIAFALYVDFTGLYSPVINGIQGRYLVALMPYFCLMISKAKFYHSDVSGMQAWVITGCLIFVQGAALNILW